VHDRGRGPIRSPARSWPGGPPGRPPRPCRQRLQRREPTPPAPVGADCCRMVDLLGESLSGDRTAWRDAGLAAVARRTEAIAPLGVPCRRPTARRQRLHAPPPRPYRHALRLIRCRPRRRLPPCPPGPPARRRVQVRPGRGKPADQLLQPTCPAPPQRR
jgi:hypothetical protein